MARIEIRCTDAYKKDLKRHVDGKGSDMTKYIKAAIYEKRLRELEEGKEG